jgi:hypothetical protein
MQQETVRLSLQTWHSSAVNNHLATREDLYLRNNVNRAGPIEPCIRVLVDRAIEGRDIKFEWISVPQVPECASGRRWWVDIDVEIKLAVRGAVRRHVEKDFGICLVEYQRTEIFGRGDMNYYNLLDVTLVFSSCRGVW